MFILSFALPLVPHSPLQTYHQDSWPDCATLLVFQAHSLSDKACVGHIHCQIMR